MLCVHILINVYNIHTEGHLRNFCSVNAFICTPQTITFTYDTSIQGSVFTVFAEICSLDPPCKHGI